jgi:hypothetical protein
VTFAGADTWSSHLWLHLHLELCDRGATDDGIGLNPLGGVATSTRPYCTLPILPHSVLLASLEAMPWSHVPPTGVGMAIRVQVPGIWPNGVGYGDDFLPAGGTRTRLEPRWVRSRYFSSPTGNPTCTQYFTTAMILGCEQVKMCSFYDINYDLLWLLNFATRLSQIFVEY